MANIAWLIHGYPPDKNAGAEWMAKEINDYLVSQGHTVYVICKGATTQYQLDGVTVVPWNAYYAPVGAFAGHSDVLLTHLDCTNEAIGIAERLKKPLGHIIHHNFEIQELRKPRLRTFVVYNTEWIAKDRQYPYLSCVVNPPVNPARFADIVVDPKYVTLVNCNEHKGGRILVELAKAMPGVQFRGVKGFHGEQFISPLPPKNLHYVEGTADIREVLKETSVLLVPSVYESYGRIGLEALACGIPVVANKTPGLQEALGEYTEASFYIDRNNISGIIKQIYIILNQGPKARVFKFHRPYQVWEQTKTQLSNLNQLIHNVIQ